MVNHIFHKSNPQERLRLLPQPKACATSPKVQPRWKFQQLKLINFQNFKIQNSNFQKLQMFKVSELPFNISGFQKGWCTQFNIYKRKIFVQRDVDTYKAEILNCKIIKLIFLAFRHLGINIINGV